MYIPSLPAEKLSSRQPGVVFEWADLSGVHTGDVVFSFRQAYAPNTSSVTLSICREAEGYRVTGRYAASDGSTHSEMVSEPMSIDTARQVAFAWLDESNRDFIHRLGEELEQARQRMYQIVEESGYQLQDSRVIAVSQEIDGLHNEINYLRETILFSRR